MIDFAAARRTMVEGQIRTFDVTDQNVLAAMLEIPRDRFVAPERAALAYLDTDVPVGAAGRDGRRLLKPMVLAKLLQAAEITAADRVLDVGCATGYASAVLSRLAGSVVALEDDPALIAQANRVLRDIAPAVTVVQGSLQGGWPALAPYDVILLDGAAEVVPPALFAQLKDGGRLVGILGEGPTGKAMIYRSVQGEVSGRPIFDATGAPLPGFSKPPAFVF